MKENRDGDDCHGIEKEMDVSRVCENGGLVESPEYEGKRRSDPWVCE
jgi:hypothetical protein